ncbi:2,3-dehydroadipyl-CoA hydratase [Pseudomonas fluorescens]|nr:2,3-dehydroadipyl-CoA hydratase [Pseudomonas fluorescens]
MNDVFRTVHDGVLTLTFNRPSRLNAVDEQMYAQLADWIHAAAHDPLIAVVLITGGPKCFTAGNDLSDLRMHPVQCLDAPLFRLMAAVTALDKPLIAAVCGPAIGIGATLLLHCDQVFVSRSACLQMPFVALGLCPEFGSSLLLARRIGQVRAARLLLCNERISAEQAVDWALANELHEDADACLDAARHMAVRLKDLPQQALRLSKRLIKEGCQAELAAAMLREGQCLIEQLQGSEAKAALGVSKLPA